MSQEEQIGKLLAQLEQRIGHPLRGKSDYNHLTDEIRERLNKTVSVSTVKRLQGKVSDHHEPSYATLDTLSQFLGYRHWQDFVARCGDEQVSQFLNHDVLMCKDLNKGDIVEITWSPARLCRLRCIALCRFEVALSVNCKLGPRETLLCQMLAIGQPFTATNITRGSKLEKVYVAAVNGGISSIRVFPYQSASR